MNFRIIALASVALIAYGQRNPDSPLDHLPENIAVLTHFGPSRPVP